MFTPPVGLPPGLVISASSAVLAGAPVEKLWLGRNNGALLNGPPVASVLIGPLEPVMGPKTFGVAGRDDIILNITGPRRGGDDPRL